MDLVSSRKGQAILFIILAIIIVMIFILVFSIMRSSPEEYEVPTGYNEYQPVYNYLEGCLKEAAKDAVQEVAMFGGYSSAISDELNPIRGQPTLSNAIYFPAESNVVLPLWYHMSSSDYCTSDCEFESEVPTIESIKSQLEFLVENDVYECMRNAEEVLVDYEIERKGMPYVEVTMNEEEVIFDLDYPIDVKEKETEGASYSLGSVRVVLNAPLLKMYNIAKEITAVEAVYSFYEKSIIDIIVANSGISREKLPPFYHFEIGFQEPVFWSALDVKDKLSNLILSYSNLFMLNGSKNMVHIGNGNVNDYDELFLNRFVLNLIGLGDFSDISYSVLFDPSWNYYFSFGGEYFAGPETAGSAPFPMNQYVIPYDISMPLVISLSDSEALEGEGLFFNFALELNIRDSEPFNATSEIYEGAESYLCLESNFLCDGKINVITNSGEGVENADVFFSSVDENCFIGKTNETGILEGKFPCGLGYLTASKGELESSEVSVLFDSDRTVEETIQMLEKKEVEAKVRKYVVTEERVNEMPIQLAPNEIAIFNLQMVSNTGNPFSTALIINGSEESKNITLVEGDYEINGFLILEENIVIPEKEICPTIELPLLGCLDDPVILESFEMNSSLMGKVELIEPAWHYDGNQESLTFYLMALDEIASYDDLEELGNLDTYVEEYKELLVPKENVN